LSHPTIPNQGQQIVGIVILDGSKINLFLCVFLVSFDQFLSQQPKLGKGLKGTAKGKKDKNIENRPLDGLTGQQERRHGINKIKQNDTQFESEHLHTRLKHTHTCSWQHTPCNSSRVGNPRIEEEDMPE